MAAGSAHFDVTVRLKFEVDAADRDNRLSGQRIAALQATFRVSVTHGHLDLSLRRHAELL